MSFFGVQRKKLSALLIALISLVISLQASVFAAQIEKTAEPSPCKAKVIEFYASWCEPCKRLQAAMNRVKQEYGSAVEFVRIDVDDPASRETIAQYEVCPIPTVIFLDRRENIKAYAVGLGSEQTIEAGIKRILPQQQLSSIKQEIKIN